jgi:hypothetical protein
MIPKFIVNDVKNSYNKHKKVMMQWIRDYNKGKLHHGDIIVAQNFLSWYRKHNFYNQFMKKILDNTSNNSLKKFNYIIFDIIWHEKQDNLGEINKKIFINYRDIYEGAIDKIDVIVLGNKEKNSDLYRSHCSIKFNDHKNIDKKSAMTTTIEFITSNILIKAHAKSFDFLISDTSFRIHKCEKKRVILHLIHIHDEKIDLF